jgi:acyl-CoA reductase-like NAD-dependent aldehyde dehydrogenase
MQAAAQPIRACKLLIDGKWEDPVSGKSLTVLNPATNEPCATVADAGEEDVTRAVQAARKAFSSGAWPKMSGAERGKILWRLSDLLMKHADELAALETLHNGKPIFESRQVDIPTAADVLAYYAGWASKVTGETLPTSPNALIYTLREPIGVIGAIVPWNFPLLLALWKVAPALACGNTVVLKPSKQTPLTALRLGELALEAGLPPGVLNVITGSGALAGMALVKHADVDKISFTGETSTGVEIMKRSADTLKRVSLELGGKSPNIVFADADLEAAVRGATTGIFYGKGEVCAAGSRLFVEAPVYDAMLEKVAARAAKMQPTDPTDPKCRMGALVSKEQLEKVMSYVDVGKEQGARLVAGGEKAQVPGLPNGNFMKPTVFGEVTNNMRIAREEIFGPVLSVIRFTDPEDAVAQANASPYGLAAAVWSKDIKKAHAMARRIKAGTVWINTYNQYDPAAPFGGYKRSGFGRELGSDALRLFTETKTVWVDLNP